MNHRLTFAVNVTAPVHAQQRSENEPENTSTPGSSSNNIEVPSYQTFSIKSIFRGIMNAAVTIFSMGVGVGLILGDSFHARSTTEEAMIRHAEGDTNESAGYSDAANDDGSDNSRTTNIGIATRTLLPPQ